jgi:hypothetical protein
MRSSYYYTARGESTLNLELMRLIDGSPADELSQLSVDKMRQEIEDSGFALVERYCSTISHDDKLNEGCVFNFTKTT